MIIFKECLKNNITPFIIDETHKLYYYRGLKEYKDEKADPPAIVVWVGKTELR